MYVSMEIVNNVFMFKYHGVLVRPSPEPGNEMGWSQCLAWHVHTRLIVLRVDLGYFP